MAILTDAAIIEAQVKKFILSTSRLVLEGCFDEDFTLFSSGVLESIDFVKLVDFLETRFSIKLVRVNMQSLDTLTEIVQVVQRAEKKSKVKP